MNNKYREDFTRCSLQSDLLTFCSKTTDFTKYSFQSALLNPRSILEAEISTPYFESQGPRFESLLRRTSTHDCMVFHCSEPFIITLPSSQYDLHNIERDVKHQTIFIY